MTDPIADMLTRIRNAQAAHLESAEVPYSKLKYTIAKLLEQRGYIRKAEMHGKKTRRMIDITLKYNEEKVPAIIGIKRISKSGQRIYKPAAELGRIRRGRGIMIVSTSSGIMTGVQAMKNRVGGEVLCEVW